MDERAGNNRHTILVRDMRSPQFFRVDDAYLNGYARLCGIYATGVYNALCRHADRNQEAFPSAATIALKLGVSKRQVFRALAKLEHHNIIQRDLSPTGKGGFRNTYLLLDKSLWKPEKLTVPLRHSETNGHRGYDYQSHPPMPDRHEKDTHIKGTHISLRERLLMKLKTLFPDADIPSYVKTRQIDYFLWRVERGLDHAKVKDPIRYLRSLLVEREDFPTLPEREEAAQRAAEKHAQEKRLRKKEIEDARESGNVLDKEQVRKFVSSLNERQ